ncbi:MAG: M1 family metallopeptidase, partial [Saprospiraceae bacterium]
SASNPTEKNAEGVYTFKMAQPIPPYLLALAVGDLVFQPIGDETGVYAEPSMIAASANEFADMQKMLEAAEDLYGEYKWERYDVIVLPPSFPFGGMENPRLTFATPTIIAGDRSLTSLIAHELAHSWSGNLVTNATWDDFWLNEGFTVYFERRIMEALYGEDYANMLAMLGYQDLENTVKDIGESHPDTHLHLNLEGRDPDDGMTDIAYEKGAYFLMMLEEQVGRDTFDVFLKNYFNTHAFQTLTTTKFIDYLQKNLLESNQLTVNLDEWIYGAGIPANAPKPTSDAFVKVEAQATNFTNGAKDPSRLQTKDWTTHEWLHFIRFLPRDLSENQMKQLDKTFGFTESGNSEIKFAWYELSIRNGFSKNIMPQISKFLVSVGRRKFLTPLYRAFKETEQLEVARSIYDLARPNYHSVSRMTMDALLEVTEEHQG